jgi:hypothetical protein
LLCIALVSNARTAECVCGLGGRPECGLHGDHGVGFWGKGCVYFFQPH